MGRQREAVAELQKGAMEPHRGALQLMYLGHALGVTGARSEARKVLDEIMSLSPRRYISPEYIAIVYEGLGERTRHCNGSKRPMRSDRSTSGFSRTRSSMAFDPIRDSRKLDGVWACRNRLACGAGVPMDSRLQPKR